MQLNYIIQLLFVVKMACLICLSVLRPDQRRRLDKFSLRSVLLNLIDNDCTISEVFTRPNIFLYRPCVRGIESIERLEKDLIQKKSTIQHQIHMLVKRYGMRNVTNTVATPINEPAVNLAPPQKRSVTSAGLEISTTPKRWCHDTPIRRMINQIHPSHTSPAVAVSCNSPQMSCYLTIHNRF